MIISKRWPKFAVLAHSLCLLAFCQVPNASADDELAVAARKVLKTHCYRCHGLEFKVPRLDVLNHERLITPPPNEETPFVTPGDLNASMIWTRLGVEQDMPPGSVKNRPSEEEIDTVKRWIEAGAPARAVSTRDPILEKSVLTSIRDHLQKMRKDDRRHQRYLTLTNIHNSPSFSNSDLRLYRAAFSKLLNSLSRRSSIVVPTVIDDPELGVVFNIDLRKYGWDIESWQTAIQGYPYGVKWRDAEIDELDEDINRMLGGDISGDGISSVRVDWFINNASRGNAYNTLLGIPNTIQELEKDRLGVDIEADFRNGQLLRAGFAGSGVSRHNRLVDRHTGANTKYYYRSYDFGESFGRSILSRFPLGPKFEGNEFNDFAFEHDGGEVIFSMPNGLQGYMLIDQVGSRLDDAPIQIVRDVTESSGSPVISNGISCMGCHKRGLLDYEDSVQAAKVLQGEQLSKLVSIYAKKDDLQETLDKDRRHFVRALEQALSPFLIEGEDYGSDVPIKRIEDMPEPVSTVSQWYDQDVGAELVAAELNLKSADYLKAAVATNDKLRQLGIGPLSDNAKVPREMWDTQDESASSVFQRVFVALGLGTAVSPISQ